ncbi:hypothetical protein B0A48_05939 [Cryoendolithus antarcticus]|uniref:Uncharacterized protein n=1 Tax=Cryoendolithus antarcticus TaxID=1507870 RepID=A0A1V8TCQ9_9PEZI|nr:hypothetical protein B0A48_05939 [Cryoendolithus antarcticus]
MVDRQVPTLVEAAQLKAVGSHEYSVHVHKDYSAQQQPDTVALHFEYLRPGVAGDAVIRIEDVRLGKASSAVQAILTQGGKEKVRAFAMNLDRSKSNGVSITTGYTRKPLEPPIDFDKLLVHQDPHWIRWENSWAPNSPAKRLSNVTLAFRKQPNVDKNMSDSWVRRKDLTQRWTTEMLGLVVDLSSPPAENHFEASLNDQAAYAREAISWAAEGKQPSPAVGWRVPKFYPTALPAEGVEWLYVRASTKSVLDGRVDVHVEVWDVEGRLVALSQQMLMALDIGRAPVAKADAGKREERL